MLEQSARDFPRDYNPPARLARAYLTMKRYDEALDAIRALAWCMATYAGVYSLKANISRRRGTRGAAAALTSREQGARDGSAVALREALDAHAESDAAGSGAGESAEEVRISSPFATHARAR